jgi:hypothetical protein
MKPLAAIRTLRRSPGFTATALLTVALSTGPTMIAMGVANWMFFRPLPGVHEPDRLGIAWFGTWPASGGFSPSRISYANVTEIQGKLSSVAALAAQTYTSVNLSPEQASYSAGSSLDAGKGSARRDRYFEYPSPMNADSR